MNRIKMPLTFRMQNFLMLGDGIFWTSASKTVWQKIFRLAKKDTSKMCNTSKGYTLPHHGQYIRRDGNMIICQEPDFDYIYDIHTGEFLAKTNSTLPNLSKIRSLNDGVALQGVTDELAVFGWPNTSYIDVININTDDNAGRVLAKRLHYKDYKKWYWSEWEPEGVQVINDKVDIGISVKTIFGIKLNYREEI